MTNGTARWDFTLGAELSDHDKTVLDTVLSALELHQHKGGSKLADPTSVLGLALATSGGQLAAGQTRYYRFSYVDQYGLETAASNEVSVSLPAPVATPSAPIVTTITGGTLASGPTYYAFTAVAGGVETQLSAPSLVTITDFKTAVITVPGAEFDPGVDSLKVWRRGPLDSGYTDIGTIADPTVAFDDNGSVPSNPCACDPATQAPTSNQTNSSNVVTITNPDTALLAAAPGNGITAWRIYVSTTSGDYPNNSLLAEVETTVNLDGTGGLVATFTDDGTAILMDGAPLDVSQALTPSRFVPLLVVNNAAALPSPATYTDGFPALTKDTFSLWAIVDGVWVDVTGGGSAIDQYTYLSSTSGGKNYRVGVQDDGTLFSELILPLAPTGVTGS